MSEAVTTKSGLTLIESYAPSLLTSLRTEFPDHKALFESQGVTLGGEIERVDAIACVAAIQVSLAVSGRAISESKQRMARSRTLVLVASILSAISSAGLLTVVAANAPKLIEYVIAVIALISSCLTIVAEFFARGTGGGQIEQAHRTIAELLPQIVTLHARLSGYLKISEWQPETVASVKTLIDEGHNLCGQIHTAAVTIGAVVLPSDMVDVFSNALPDKSALIPKPRVAEKPQLKPVDQG